MDQPLDILVTNDDGIDSPGLVAVADALESYGDVTVVAPADDQSAVGRAMSSQVEISNHEYGYAVHGTPTDCVVAGVSELAPEPDLVVSGCNRGANLGTYTLGKSGTVSAAVEASFFGIPAIALSLYVPTGATEYDDRTITKADYAEATGALEYLLSTILAAEHDVFDRIDYLNVNAPVPEHATSTMTLTRPSDTYDMDATRIEDTVTLHDRIWDRMAEGTVEEPDGTDRGTILNGSVSVTPLSTTHDYLSSGALDEIAGAY